MFSPASSGSGKMCDRGDSTATATATAAVAVAVAGSGLANDPATLSIDGDEERVDEPERSNMNRAGSGSARVARGGDGG